MYVHLTLNAAYCPIPLHRSEVAAGVWRGLRKAFPDAVACTIMPEHVHVLAWAESPKAACRRAGHLLASFRRSKRSSELTTIEWAPVKPPREIPNQKHLARQVRYVALNPCRRRMVDDPLRWPWSTHRDVVGAVVDPWICASRLADALGRSRHHFAERHHAYVSGDPTVEVSGTAFPRPAIAESIESHPLAWLGEAAAAATRRRPEDIRSRGSTRALYLRLARHVGWRSTERLAAQCAMSPHGVRALLRRLPRADLAPALLCLGDERLRAYSATAVVGEASPPPVEVYGALPPWLTA